MIQSGLDVAHSTNVSGNDEILELRDGERVLKKMSGEENLEVVVIVG